jgi:23S rRNA (guanosine2251-2'-O)-methyltransferase
MLYGRNAVREAMRANRRRCIRLLISERADAADTLKEIEQLARSLPIPVEAVSRQRLDDMVFGHHQGVVLEVSPYPYVEDVDLNDLAEQQAILLVLDSIVDPQNVGTLLRTAEATGVRLVVIPNDRAASITPAVVNASSGGVEHLQVSQEVNLVRWMARAKEAGFWIVGLAGDDDAQPMFDTNMNPPIALVVGSEGSGLRRLVRETCDMVVSIPMFGNVESLNAATAGSIALYEIVRDAEPVAAIE